MDFQDHDTKHWHNKGCILARSDCCSEDIARAGRDVIRRTYYQHVRFLAEQIVKDLRDKGGHMVESELNRWINQQSKCHWSFGGHLPELVCLVSENSDEDPNDNPEKKASKIIRQDIEDIINSPSSHKIPIKRIRNGVILEGMEAPSQ